jgi:E3 ubiquitin-protein ligase TRIP12
VKVSHTKLKSSLLGPSRNVKEEGEEDVIPSSDAPLLPVPTPIPAVLSSGTSSSRRGLSVEPEDAHTLRARAMLFKYLSGSTADEGDTAFRRLRALTEELKIREKDKDAAKATLVGIVDLVASSDTSVSSFKLLQSGSVDVLLAVATGKEYSRKSFGGLFFHGSPADCEWP